MNIALIGVPGAGKTELAHQIGEALANGDKTYTIIDNYIDDIEEHTGWALGPFGTYVGNLYVALDRYARETKARGDVDITITCGTLLETAVYQAVYFVGLANNQTDEEKQAMAPLVESVLRMLAVLYNDIVEYDYAFYLPPVDPNEDVAFFDKQLQAGVGGFQLLDISTLADPETRLEDALKVLTSEVPAS